MSDDVYDDGGEREALSERAGGEADQVADNLLRMLEEGPLVSVKENAEGAFELCTAVIRASAPVDVVWSVLSDFESYHDFIPRVRRADVTRRTETTAVVALELDTPVCNTKYAMAYELCEAERKMVVRWHSGDLKGTYGEWHLVPENGATTLFYKGATQNFSRVIKAFEDDKQTITVAVNVSSAMAMVRAMKDRSESVHATRRQ